MGYKFNPFTGNFDITDSPDGVFDSVEVNGDINLDDGGSFTTTVQCVTPTQNRTISFPDATGTVALVAGSSGQLTYNNAGAYAGVANSTVGGTGNITLSLAGAASTPPVSLTGTWFTGGTGTTTKPQLLIEPTGTTSTAWSTSGTGIGVNAASTFSGNLLDLQVNGTSQFSVANTGRTSIPIANQANLRFGTSTSGFGSRSAGTITCYISDGVAIDVDSSKVEILQPLRLSNTTLGFSSGFLSSSDLVLARDASNTLAQRNGTSAQVTRVYDTYTSDTDYHRLAIATARATLNNVSGASVTANGLIPAGAVVVGVTSKVTTALGTTNGTTGYQVGTGADADRWGAITGTVAGTSSDNRNWTVGTIECFPTATDVIVTATGGNFNGTGAIYLSVQYMTGQAD